MGKMSKLKRQRWLHITAYGLTIAETGASKNGMPYFTVIACVKLDNAIDAVDSHIDWVRKYCKKSINIVLHHSLYQLLLSDVPDVPDEELHSAIELKAADLLPYDIDDAVLDVIQLPAEAYRGRMRMAFIIAALKKPLSLWLVALAKKGIKVPIIDTDTTALRNLAVSHQQYSESGILHIKNHSSRLLLNYNSELVLSRSFDIGLNSLTEENVVDDGELELTVSDNERASIQVDSLALEIRRSFDYYEAQLGLGAIAEMMFICDERHSQVAMNVAERLGSRFTLLKPSDHMTVTMPDDSFDTAEFYSILGCAYRGALS